MQDQTAGMTWKNGKFMIRIRHVVAVNLSIFALIQNLCLANTIMSSFRDVDPTILVGQIELIFRKTEFKLERSKLTD